jgi:hypothetical protein
MFAVAGVELVLTAMNAPILPTPFDPSPMEMLSFVQMKSVPVPVKFMAETGAALQTTWSAGSLTVGVGLTVIVNVWNVPLQTAPPECTGVTMMVEVTGVLPKFTAVNGPILPVPLAESPIEALSFVHVYPVAPVPVKFMAAVDAPLHST